ncbi:hypothetical protein QEN19_000683 [Hanseniaspora menglaensis]
MNTLPQNLYILDQKLQIVKVFKQSIANNSSSDLPATNNPYFLNNYYIYAIRFKGDIINRRYNEFELLYQILKKLFPTDLLPSIPKKETLMEIMKQQANNSIDITSKTLASGYSNLLHLKDSILSYTSGTTHIENDVSKLEDNDKLVTLTESKAIRFNIPENHMLKKVDLSSVTDKDLKLIRHRCILFQDFLNELIVNEKIYKENNILKEFLNPKNINFVDFIKSYSLINQTLLANDILRINPSDPLGTEYFYKYLPLPSVTGRGSLPKVSSVNNNSSDNFEDQNNEDEQEEDGTLEEVLESDDSDFYDQFSSFVSPNLFFGDSNGRRVSEPINGPNRKSSFSSLSPEPALKNRSSSDSKRPYLTKLENDLASYLDRNNDKLQKADSLVKEYKKRIVSKMLKILKKFSKNISSLQTVQEAFVESLEAYHSADASLPSYDFDLLNKLNDILDDFCGRIYYNCLEKMKELDALNDNCLQLIKFSKNKIKQKELLSNLIGNETLKLDHLKRKIEIGSESSKSEQSSIKETSPKLVDDNYSKDVDGNFGESKKVIFETSPAQPIQGVSAKFSPFIKKLSSFTSIVKEKYNHTLQPTKDELETKVANLKEVLSHLEKNEKCINEDILFILNQVYGKDVDQFTKKIDNEMINIINLISEAMHTYSLKSLENWQTIANKYAS